MFTPQNPITLKIKGLSLAQEARIIRQIEKRLKKGPPKGKHANPEHQKYHNGLTFGKWAETRRKQFNEIQPHRRFEIRAESRATHLARMFLKGKPYAVAEVGAYASNLIEQFPPLSGVGSWDRFMGRIFDIANNFYEGDQRDLAQSFGAWKDAAWNWYADHEPVKKPKKHPAQQAVQSS